MSLTKQLVLLISFIFLTIFTVNFYASIANIRNYLQVEAETHAQDTATSLGMSLSPYILDENNLILETMINAIFDRGYYLAIKLENRKGEVLVSKTNPKTFENVPDWFTELLPMKTVTAKSDIDAGWVRGGTVFVTIHPGFGYLKLWEQARQALIYSALMLLISIVLLIIILRIILRSLKRIDKLALSIADGNFDTIDRLPRTTEVRNIAISMNYMSNKIEQVIKNLQERLEESGRRLRVDELTGLETRASFETEMKQRFMAGKSGYIFLLKIDCLGKLAQVHSSEKVDNFIRQFVVTTQKVQREAGLPETSFFRLLGAEFTIIGDCRNGRDAGDFCEKLLARLKKLGAEYGEENVAHIGVAVFDPHGTTSSIMSKAAEAMEKARLISTNAYAITEESGNTRDKELWQTIVSQTIDTKRIEVDYTEKAYSLQKGEEQQLVIEEARAKVCDNDGLILPIGTFISVAENIGKITAFDLFIVNRVMAYIRENAINHDVAVNFTSLASNEFRASLYELLTSNKEVRQNLVFCVTAYAATRNLEAFSSFIDFVHRNRTKILLKRFESRFIPMNEIKQFKLDYIRLARVYTENIHSNKEKQRMVKAMRELGDILNINVVAEAAGTEADRATLQKLGIKAASR